MLDGIVKKRGAPKPRTGSKHEAEMKAAGVDYKLVKYPGAVHSFTHKEAGTDNAKGAAYNADADRDSWFQMQEFLKRAFSL